MKSLSQDPRSPGFHDQTKMKEPRSPGSHQIQKFKIQDLRDPTGKHKFRIQDSQDPRSPGYRYYRTNFKDPGSARSHNEMNVQRTRSTGSRNKMPKPSSIGSDRKNYKIQDANFMKIAHNPENVNLST